MAQRRFLKKKKKKKREKKKEKIIKQPLGQQLKKRKIIL